MIIRKIVLTLGLVALAACGKQGVIVPPNNQAEIKNVYPAPSCMDKLTDIRQSANCPDQR